MFKKVIIGIPKIGTSPEQFEPLKPFLKNQGYEFHGLISSNPNDLKKEIGTLKNYAEIEEIQLLTDGNGANAALNYLISEDQEKIANLTCMNPMLSYLSVKEFSKNPKKTLLNMFSPIANNTKIGNFKLNLTEKVRISTAVSYLNQSLDIYNRNKTLPTTDLYFPESNINQENIAKEILLNKKSETINFHKYGNNENWIQNFDKIFPNGF